MRGLPRLAAALALGLAIGCYHDDFLLGALCNRDEHCGADQCCAGFRCRPAPDDCDIGETQVRPFLPAYDPCDTDDECLLHGLVRCVHWEGADKGFCADLCVGPPSENCTNHEFEFFTAAIPRTCVMVDEKSVCALDCTDAGRCPDDMLCHIGVCVPKP